MFFSSKKKTTPPSSSANLTGGGKDPAQRQGLPVATPIPAAKNSSANAAPTSPKLSKASKASNVSSSTTGGGLAGAKKKHHAGGNNKKVDDFGATTLDDDEVVFDTDDGDSDEDSDNGGRQNNNKKMKPSAATTATAVGNSRNSNPFGSSSVPGGSDDGNESGSDDEDVVKRAQAKKGPLGLLAPARRRGSDNSSQASSNDSSNGDENEEVEDLLAPGNDEGEDEQQNPGDEDGDFGEAESDKQQLPLDVLREVPFFKQFPENQQQQLFNELVTETFKDGDTIVKQGEEGDRFFVIIDGEAVVSKTMENGETIDLTHIYRGDYFGELVLIYGGNRIATVTSVGNTTCMSLSKKSFEQPEYDEIRYFLILSKVPLLSGLSKENQLRIVEKLRPAKFDTGEYVVKQGERGDAFFLITKGSVVVVEDNDKIITRLYEGHSFGEMALLTDEPRVASVRAASELNVMYLGVSDFKELLSAEDFSALLENENRRIKELRDRRQFKRRSVNNPNGNAAAASLGSPQLSPSSPPGSYAVNSPQLLPQGRSSNAPVTTSPLTTPGNNNNNNQNTTRQRAPSASVRANATTQQKLKTGKTAGGAKIINGYVLLEQIGKGTFGVVRLCEQVDTKERFAMKIIDKKLFNNKVKAKNQATLEDMRREAAIMKRLHHENIVSLIDVIDDPKADQLYIVQEYCALGALMEKLEGNEPLKEATARKYFRDLLSGLDYLHAHSIIHRDIKPMNLLLTADHVVKIGDFGAARVLLQGNQAVGVAGTPAFMAPELLSQDAAQYNGPAVDLWSAGATLFMMCTGVPPWMADDEITLARRVRDDELVFPDYWFKALSPHLRNLITRLLVKDPAQRLTLDATVEHEWVTEEGSDPLPRFTEVQPALLRVGSIMSGLVSPDEMKDALSTVQDTPAVTTGRKTVAGAIPEEDATTTSRRADNSPDYKVRLKNETLSLNTAGGEGAGKFAPNSPKSPPGGSSSPSRKVPYEERAAGSSTLTATDSALDFSQFDVGKKMDEGGEGGAGDRKSTGTGLTPEGRRPASSSGASAHQIKAKKKMSVVQAFTRRLPSSTSAARVGRHRSNSKASAASRDSFSSSLADDSDAGGGEEMSLSAILNDKTLYAEHKKQEAVRADITLRPLATRTVVRAKRGHHVTHCSVRYGYGEDVGIRQSMEDMISIVPKMRMPDTFFAAIFDGHNGDLVSKELKLQMHRELSKQPDFSLSAMQHASAAANVGVDVLGSGGGSAADGSAGANSSFRGRMTGAASGANAASNVNNNNNNTLPATASSGSIFSMTSAASSMVLAPTREDDFGDSFGLPRAIRKACLALDRALLHKAATELIDIESKIQQGEKQKGLFRTKGGGPANGGIGDMLRTAGSTAVLALIRGGGKPNSPCVVTIGWVGDSRAVLSRGGVPVELSKDHKASREDEKARIRAAGGTVDRQGRLYGAIAVSRAFGDLQHKGTDLKVLKGLGPVAKPGEEGEYGAEGTLIAVPDTMQFVVQPEDEFIVLASDGVWDVMSNEQVVNFVRFHLFQHGDVRKAAAELIDKALAMASVDNVSAVIVGFVGR